MRKGGPGSDSDRVVGERFRNTTFHRNVFLLYGYFVPDKTVQMVDKKDGKNLVFFGYSDYSRGRNSKLWVNCNRSQHVKALAPSANPLAFAVF